MAKVTVFNAARMLAIEAGTVVSGLVDNGRLMLQRRDGTVVDAGQVQGQRGLPGVNAVENDTAVAAYIDAEDSATRASLSATFARLRDYDVRNYGTFSAFQTSETNRATVQAAINAAAAAGGGRVVIPPGGTYNIKGVVLDSHVHLDWSGATLRHPDGSTLDVIRTRQTTTTGSIAWGNNVLGVADATGIEPGAIIAIRGAGGLSDTQTTTLTAAITTNQTEGITLTSAAGFHTSGLLQVGAELISYTGLSGATLTGVTRGVYSRPQSDHASGAPIGVATRLVTSVVSVNGTNITVDPDRPAVFSLTGADITFGTLNARVSGHIDGNRIAGGSTSTLNAVRFDLARFWRADLTVENAEAAIYANVSWDGRYNVVASNCSVPEASKGACLWLFQQCHRNEGTLHAEGDMWTGLYLDNRTNTATEYDGGCNDNAGRVIVRAQKHTPWVANSALLIVAGNRNRYDLIGGGTRTGLVIESTAQVYRHDATKPTARGNKVDVLLSEVYQPWAVYEPGNIISGYYEAAANGVNTGGSLIALASIAPGGNPQLGLAADGTQTAPGMGFQTETNTGFYRIGAGQVQYVSQGVLGVRLTSNGLRFTDTAAAQLLDVGTANGLRIGGGGTQKLGFYGTTPIVRPTGTPAAASDLATALTLVNDLRVKLLTLGLIA